MICKNCQKEVADESKFCEFCGGKINKYKEVIDKILKEKQSSENEKIGQAGVKKGKWFQRLKNTILILSVFITTAFLIEMSYDLDGEGIVIAIPITILIYFVYNKLAKKFDL